MSEATEDDPDEVLVGHRLYDPAPGARLIGLKNTSALRKMLRTGEIAGIDVSSNPGKGRPRWKVRGSELIAWLERRTHRPTPAPSKQQRRPSAPALAAGEHAFFPTA
ncbi:hypothetical protein [Alienimonas sp. DA493]|uniref:hypothetical protein n=1 Tax=Alienimonas sp. DA493 TaxID=3373605 RepID=UPI0037540E1A